ncbi:MAG: preprotein translocase subunit SecF [Firmicutes bacterium ADurb.Bin193]|nr:MAG: preprotein translocase subunit SecF [Firmicutes bacterium ADurb.Bin193]
MIDFYKNRWKYYIISLAIIALGIIMIFVNGGIKLAIEFKGGAIIRYSFEGELDINEVGAFAAEIMGRDVAVQEISSNISGKEGDAASKKIVLNFAGDEGLSDEAQLKLDAALKEKYPDAKFVSAGSSVVKPFIGKRFLARSMRAILLASILMILYIWYSFRKISGLSAGVMSFVALLHDVIVVFFVFIIFNIPINESFIAVSLTILGYSLNDTIVIFDRIRENKRFMGAKVPIEEIVTKSINQSLTRSINTGVATFISIVVVYIFAAIYDIESIKTFALPMAFGIISGAYSTICLVGPMWTSWQKFITKDKIKTA